MPVAFRPAAIRDLQRADELVVSSINDLTVRHGFGPMASVRPTNFQSFSLQDDPGGLWVAEDDGEMLGFAFSWVCGDLWFLAQLFVSPHRQALGIGNELLKRTLEHARQAGAAHKALITFTFNRVSQGLYIRHGMFPRLPIYNFQIPRKILADRLQPTSLRCTALEDSSSHRHSLAEIDGLALGVSREKHHRYLLKDGATRGVFLHEGKACIGYVYVSSDGHIGPMAVRWPDAMEAAFRTALNIAAEAGSEHISAFLPGTSDATLSVAAEHRMQITFPMVLASTPGFGNWTQYLPRNPGFM